MRDVFRAVARRQLPQEKQTPRFGCVPAARLAGSNCRIKADCPRSLGGAGNAGGRNFRFLEYLLLRDFDEQRLGEFDTKTVQTNRVYRIERRQCLARWDEQLMGFQVNSGHDRYSRVCSWNSLCR